LPGSVLVLILVVSLGLGMELLVSATTCDWFTRHGKRMGVGTICGTLLVVLLLLVLPVLLLLGSVLSRNWVSLALRLLALMIET